MATGQDLSTLLESEEGPDTLYSTRDPDECRRIEDLLYGVEAQVYVTMKGNPLTNVFMVPHLTVVSTRCPDSDAYSLDVHSTSPKEESGPALERLLYSARIGPPEDLGKYAGK